MLKEYPRRNFLFLKLRNCCSCSIYADVIKPRRELRAPEVSRMPVYNVHVLGISVIRYISTVRGTS